MFPSSKAAEFMKWCAEGFALPEAERDLLSEPDTSLLDAAMFHNVNVSFVLT